MISSTPHAGLLDVDVATEGSRDRRREVVAGELLRSPVERHVSVGDVDRLVWHVDIVTPDSSE
jgi:hypothetical protein